MVLHFRGNPRGIGSLFRSPRLICRILPKLVILIMAITLIITLEKRYQESSKVVIDLTNNYFQHSSELYLLVNTDKCKVPDLGLWELSVLSVLAANSTPRSRSWWTATTDPLDCDRNLGNAVRATYVENGRLIANQEALQSVISYVDLKYLHCCYQSIERVEQSEDEYDKQADNQFRYSENCYPMANVTELNATFIRVSCTNRKLFVWGKLAYRTYHLVARLPNITTDSVSGNENDEDSRIVKKIKFWQNCTTANGDPCLRPPNVLVIGIDSTSNLHFQRFMVKTRLLLEKLGSHEMSGYTKVQANSDSPMMPLLTGYSAQELRNICLSSRWPALDHCPWIWKNFDKLNYLTAHLEDTPNSKANLNYRKTGFIRKPVDIYTRPWMLAAYEGKEKVDCIGHCRPEAAILEYIVDLIALSDSQRLPYFITTWLSDLTEDNVLGLQKMDVVLYNFLLTLRNKGLLDNTMLVVMSNHGYQYHNVRTTTSGWYEDKLPVMLIKLPYTITSKQPAWEDALQNNSDQLTTAFDLHATFQSVVKFVAEATGSLTNLTSEISLKHKLRGRSLFKKLPVRSCKGAGVPAEFCACSFPEVYPATEDLTIIQNAAQEVVTSINAKLLPVCKPLLVSTITAAAIYPQSEAQNRAPFLKTYVISLIANPGNFRMEARVIFSTDVGRFVKVESVTLTNKANAPTHCLADDEVAMKMDESYDFCYCDSWLSI